MTKFLMMCCLATVFGFAVPASAEEKLALRLVQTIALPGLKGASITWAWIWKRSAFLWPPVTTIRWSRSFEKRQADCETLVLVVIMKHFRYQLRPGHSVWPMLRVTLRPATCL
jgi:hypothetical protein